LSDPKKLGFFGKVGAWLRIWTPPKDVEVPPPPSRKRLAGMAILGLLIAGVLAALVIPPLQRGKEAGERREQAAHRETIRREQASLRADQRPRFADGRRPPGGDTPSARREARAQLERMITGDARARVKAGKLRGPVRETSCDPSFPTETTLSKRTGLYKCLVVTGRTKGSTGAALSVGYPFVARIDYRRFSFAWCKTNPRPGEQAGENLAHVKLDPRCAGRLREIL
jgi:type II secretory pathway pseudopilin PulG